MKKGNKEPNPMVQLSVQDITRESKVSLLGKAIMILEIVCVCVFWFYIQLVLFYFALRPVTQPLIQSGRKLSPSSSRILASKT